MLLLLLLWKRNKLSTIGSVVFQTHQASTNQTQERIVAQQRNNNSRSRARIKIQNRIALYCEPHHLSMWLPTLLLLLEQQEQQQDQHKGKTTPPPHRQPQQQQHLRIELHLSNLGYVFMDAVEAQVIRTFFELYRGNNVTLCRRPGWQRPT